MRFVCVHDCTHQFYFVLCYIILRVLLLKKMEHVVMEMIFVY